MKRACLAVLISVLGIGLLSCSKPVAKPRVQESGNRVLVVYHSYWGNTRIVAQAIAQAVNADTAELQTQEPLRIENWKPILGGREIAFDSTPPLAPVQPDPLNYDIVFVGTPVWMWQHTPVVNSFLSSGALRGKRVALFCTYANRTGNTLGGMRARLQGSTVIGERAFRRPQENQSQAESDASEWAKSVVGE